MADTAFLNRLKKNVAHRRKWAAKYDLTAYRVYDQDIPEYRYTVDAYADHAYVVEFRRHGVGEEQRQEVLVAVQEVMGIPPERIHTKTRERMPWGRAQYEKLASSGQRLEVREQGLRFLVNLVDYLDTGLFLDHRITRDMVRKESQGKRVLNLFCYTGSFTVYAAHGGASATTSVDLSNTYLQWAEDNLRLNGLWGPTHQLVRSDVTRWLGQVRGQVYDLIVMDPPSFSSSAKMEGTLDIQRDHVPLITGALALLRPGGVLYFSTNFTSFQLDERVFAGMTWRELTPGSIPDDIRNKKIHRCWRVVR
ncbi:MAG: class I SAM-dependent methyltransferase [Myxococcota bacterium]